MTTLAAHRAFASTRVPRTAGKHRPGDDTRDDRGRLLIAEADRKAADWTPTPAWVRAQRADPDTYIPAGELELTGRLNPSEVLS